MSDPNERDAKLVQYLNEAYGKERELEIALQVDIAMTTKTPYKKRLKQHLKETKAHAKALERRIKKLGGGSQRRAGLVGKATAAAKGPLHTVRGSGEQEKMLKNAKTQYTAEHEEISTYLALETFATKVGDTETAKLARDIRRDEERMAKFLEGQISQLAGATALAEVPAAQRRAAKHEIERAKRRDETRQSDAAKPKAKPSRQKSGCESDSQTPKPSKAKSAKRKRRNQIARKPNRAKAKSTKRKSAKKTRRQKIGAGLVRERAGTSGRRAAEPVRGGFGSSRGSSWISRSARGRPSSISRLRSRSAFSWWPKRIARLVIQNQISSTIEAAERPVGLVVGAEVGDVEGEQGRGE